MQLGERIYLLRTAKNLSQGDLAERLDVSRQSISKWENNNAVPDLEKLLKLSEVFGITLDELVKGEAPVSSVTKPAAESAPQAAGLSGQKVAGMILLALAAVVFIMLTALGGIVAGAFFAGPFLVCGIICMVYRYNVGLWCAWAVVIMVDLYLRYATGLSWGTVFLTFRWTYRMNYARLAIAWVQFLVILTLICVTAVRLKNRQAASSKKRLIGRWGVVVLYTFALWVLGQVLIRMVQNAGGNLSALDSMYSMYSIVQDLLDWGRIMAFAAALTETLRHLKQKKA